MPSRRKPNTTKNPPAVVLRLEVNLLADGRCFTTVVDPTTGPSGTPVAAVPQERAAAAGSALLVALMTTPGLLPEALAGNTGPLVCAIAGRSSSDPGAKERAVVTYSDAQASPADIVGGINVVIDALAQMRINYALEASRSEYLEEHRKSLN